MRCLLLVCLALIYSGSSVAQLVNMTFTVGPTVQLRTSAHPTDIAVADFDRDGRADLAITVDGLDSVVVFKQRPGGIFAPRPDHRYFFVGGKSVVALPLIYGSASNPAPPADALAVTNGNYIRLFDNPHNAQGTLNVRGYISIVNGSFSSTRTRLLARPLSADRYIDVAISLGASPYIVGGAALTGSNTTPTVYPTMFTMPNPIPSLAVANFYGSGRLDAIIPDPVDNRIYVIENSSQAGVNRAWWSTAVQQSFPSGGVQPISAAGGDIDGDGTADLVAVHTTSRDIVLTFQALTAATQVQIPMISTPQQVELTDLTGDGKPEVVVLTTDGGVWFYHNTGLLGVNAIDPQPFYLFGANNPAYLRVADVNADGKPDVLVPTFGDDAVHIYYNQSGPLSTKSATVAQLQMYPNPAHNEVRVEYLQGGIRALRLLDVLGRPVRQWTSAASPLVVADLPRGLYILQATTSVGLVSKRLVLE